MNKWLLLMMNKLSPLIPYAVRRRVLDFPGALKLFQSMAKSSNIVTITPENYKMVLNPLFHGRFLGSENILTYEPELRESLNKIVAEGMIAYDVGANIGVFSLLFVKLVGENGYVYAFEPEANNFECLSETIRINNFKNLILDRRGIGKTISQQLFDRRGGSFSGRVIDNDISYKVTSNITEIKTVSIDHLVFNEGMRAPDIIKIDVEGFEARVIEGMEMVMEKYNPMIVCELHSHLGDPTRLVYDLLGKHGYVFYALQDVINGRSVKISPHDVGISKILAVKDRGV